MSWNKELERVKQGVARKVREFIKNTLPWEEGPEQRERSVAQTATVYNDLGLLSHGVGFYDHLHSKGCIVHAT